MERELHGQLDTSFQTMQRDLFASGMVAQIGVNAFAIWQDNWKMIYREKAQAAGGKEVELYDHTLDPAEKTDVAGQHPAEVKGLMAEIRQWIEAQDKVRKLLGPGEESKLDRQSIERLRSLGYLGGK